MVLAKGGTLSVIRVVVNGATGRMGKETLDAICREEDLEAVGAVCHRDRGNLLKFGRNYLKKNNVLVLEFDKYGILTKKEFYNKKKMKKVSFAKDVTENEIRKENFIEGFLSSVRQKMEQRKQ